MADHKHTAYEVEGIAVVAAELERTNQMLADLRRLVMDLQARIDELESGR